MRADREELEALGAGFEGSYDLWGDADRVKGPDLEKPVVEFDLPAAAEDHVDLFGADVAMCERGPLARPKAEVGHAGLFGIQSLAGDARLPIASEIVSGCSILDLVQVEPRVQGGHLTLLVALSQ